MGRRKKRQPKSAYLKKPKFLYDPYSPYALRTRGVRVINLSGLVRNSETGELVQDGTPVTISHGPKGLTLARVNSIPLVQAKVRREAVVMREQTQSIRQRGFDEFHRKPLVCYAKYSLELYFYGQEFFFLQEDHKKMLQSWSMIYKTMADAMSAMKRKDIYWSEVVPLKNTS